MSLFSEQDFSPTPLTLRWFAIKCRPNILLLAHSNVITILESGVMFREDSASVEQALEAEGVPRGAGGWPAAWVGAGAAVVAVAAVALPSKPRLLSSRSLCVCAGAALAARAVLRARRRSGLAELLSRMAAYALLARKMLICLKDYQVARKHLGAISDELRAATSLLCRQHGHLLTLVARCLLSMLAGVPWLRAELGYDQLARDEVTQANLMKMHHTLLVTQSIFVRQLAMAHLEQPKETKLMYQNHNERLYWLHTELINHMLLEFTENHATLDRVYRALKNFGCNTVERKGVILNESWLYSEVSAGIARTNIELKVASAKCASLDEALEEYAMTKSAFNVDSIDERIDGVIDTVADCLKSLQVSQSKLRSIHAKYNPTPKLEIPEAVKLEEKIVRIEDDDVEPTDQVFYFVKTEEDCKNEEVADIMTAPGKRERDNTKIVLGELKRKLVKREDAMRKREKAALLKANPHLKGKLPYFPRQIRTEDPKTRRGFIHKIRKEKRKNKLSRRLKRRIRSRFVKNKRFILRIGEYDKKPDKIPMNCRVTNDKVNTPIDITTVTVEDKQYVITRWIEPDIPYVYLSPEDAPGDDSENCQHLTHAIQHNKKIAYLYYLNGEKPQKPKQKKNKVEKVIDSSDSDFEFYTQRKITLLEDIRKHRVARRKNHPVCASNSRDTDDDLDPVEPRVGAGMALASVVQSGVAPSLGCEEVFCGNGEVSEDSGNEF